MNGPQADRADVSRTQCDVLIVGGGPAGLFLAILLQQRGVDAVVLERRTETSTHSRAIGLHPPALNALQAVGLDEAALTQGALIEGGTARSRGRQLGHLSFERPWPRRPFVLALPQSRTEDLLRHRLAQLAPDALRRGWEVLDVHDVHGHGGVAQVRAQRCPAPGTDSAPAHTAVMAWRARVVVGADGANSTVRELAGIDTDLRSYPDTYLMGDFVDLTDDPGTATIHLEPGGVVESFPLPGKQRRWVAHTGSTPGASLPIDLAAIVRSRTGEQIDPASNTMISAFSVRRRSARRMVSNRQVLIGDAAHEISPIGGQGITLGWLDGVALAPLLEQVVARDLRHPLPTMPPLRSFDRARRSAARTAGRLAEVNMALGRPRPILVARARDTAIRAVLRTPLRHRMAWVYSMGWA